MLEERLESREHQAEALGRVGHLFDQFVPTASETLVRDRDERRPVRLGCEPPFDCRGTTRSRPLDAMRVSGSTTFTVTGIETCRTSPTPTGPARQPRGVPCFA